MALDRGDAEDPQAEVRRQPEGVGPLAADTHVAILAVDTRRGAWSASMWRALGRAIRDNPALVSPVTVGTLASLVIVGAFVAPHARAQGTTAV